MVGKIAKLLSFGINNATKLQAAHIGIKLCVELKLPNIMVEGDSMVIINALCS